MSRLSRALATTALAAATALPLAALAASPAPAQASPCSFADTGRTMPGQDAVVSPLWNDSCSGDPADTAWVPSTLRVVGADAGGALMQPGIGTWTVHPNAASPIDSTVTFTPAPGFLGTATAAYEVEVEAGGRTVNTMTVRVDDLKVVDDEATTTVGVPVVIPVEANDSSDFSLLMGNLVVGGQEVPGPYVDAQGNTWELRGFFPREVVFTPAPDFVGTATIDYVTRTSSPDIVSATGTVTVTVVDPSAPPTATPTATATTSPTATATTSPTTTTPTTTTTAGSSPAPRTSATTAPVPAPAGGQLAHTGVDSAYVNVAAGGGALLLAASAAIALLRRRHA